MARKVDFKVLSALLSVAVVSLIISNIYFYRGYNSSRRESLETVVSRNPQAKDQLLRRFDSKVVTDEEDVASPERLLKLVDSMMTTDRAERQSFAPETRTVDLTMLLSSKGDSHGVNNKPAGPYRQQSSKGSQADTLYRQQSGKDSQVDTLYRQQSGKNSQADTLYRQQSGKNSQADTLYRQQSGKNSQADTVPLNTAGRFPGYVMAMKIYEQQTMATGSLMQLQCFAGQLGLSAVVQPLTEKSHLLMPPEQSHHERMMPLEDVYDMSHWNGYARDRGYVPLVRWEEFLERAPRSVVLVQMRYTSVANIKRMQEDGVMFPRLLSGSLDYKEGCLHRTLDRAMTVLRDRGFRTVGRLCYNFQRGDMIPLQTFQRELLEHGENVTFIVDEWRGIGENQRVILEEDICLDSARFRDLVRASYKVKQDAERYTSQYLHQNGETDYVAVIARFEMTVLSCKIKGQMSPSVVLPTCTKDTLKYASSMKKDKKLSNVFLSIDIGKYGSDSFAKKKYYGEQQGLESFVVKVYGGRMNISSLEQSFESVVSRLDSGYIAMVQQELVARSKCAVFVGGGSFQQHTMQLYNTLHPDEWQRCVKVVGRCTSIYRPVQ